MDSISSVAAATIGSANQVLLSALLPELETLYKPARYSTLVTTGATPIPNPVIRHILTGYDVRVESELLTASGTLAIYILCLDGNWHRASATSAVLAASTTYATSVNLGGLVNGANAHCANAEGLPALGIALATVAGFTGGGAIDHKSRANTASFLTIWCFGEWYAGRSRGELRIQSFEWQILGCETFRALNKFWNGMVPYREVRTRKLLFLTLFETEFQ